MTLETFPPVLRDFLRRSAADYDVVEYDHTYLPYPRSDFPRGPLFVARCVLLHHHFLTTPFPHVRATVLVRSAPHGPAVASVAGTESGRKPTLTVRHADLTVVQQ